ncbi:ankyrin repeat domain-containing protein [Candidatus Wolbachia massiliensis]|uniref:Ankyrin repeat domain-containing protein n=2 Tax=Candidatus Wolbachia massiliensis TaxID=1845000 RepID=A0A7M3U370_9RICK|nr:ankyrin repeat domain-containing protein [Candidatus Wolbachia massiliensis]
MSYNKIREIVTKNPDITAEEFGEELKKEKIDIKITNQDGWTLLYYAVRSEGPSIISDRSIFLEVVKLLTNLNIGTHFKDTASKTVLDTAAVNGQADVVKILLESGKFSEEEKFNALRSTIVQGNVQEAILLLSYVGCENKRAALSMALDIGKTEVTDAFLNSGKFNDENKAGSSASNGNVGNKPVPSESTDIGSTATPSSNNTATGSTDAQSSLRNEQETKYKESKGNFYASLAKDAVGVVITGLLIAAAVVIPSVAGAVVCGIVAALVTIATGLHVKNSTLPSYREMEENRVERAGTHIGI